MQGVPAFFALPCPLLPLARPGPGRCTGRRAICPALPCSALLHRGGAGEPCVTRPRRASGRGVPTPTPGATRKGREMVTGALGRRACTHISPCPAFLRKRVGPLPTAATAAGGPSID